MNNTFASTIIETPIGRMRAIASNKGLCALEFLKPTRQKMLTERLRRWYGDVKLSIEPNVFIEEAKVWLDAYFSDDTAKLPKIKLDMRGTDFELKVWQGLRKLRPGEKISYSELAQRLGIPKAQRAVGNANRRNPIPLIVPCHRVIGASGKLVGYAGGLQQKDWLIRHENKYISTRHL